MAEARPRHRRCSVARCHGDYVGHLVDELDKTIKQIILDRLSDPAAAASIVDPSLWREAA